MSKPKKEEPQNGKGDKRRPGCNKKYRDNYDRIFGKKKEKKNG